MPRGCDNSYLAFCARAAAARAAAARALLSPALTAGDPESIHDVRVACRRLRAALAALEPCRPDRARKWNRAVRRIIRALGQARDLDVQAAFIDAFRERLSGDERAGLDRLSERLSRLRLDARARLRGERPRSEIDGLLLKMEGRLARWMAAAPEAGPHSAAARRLAGRSLVSALERLESYARFLPRAAAVREHHKMRIAAKRLRYALEIFDPMYGGKLKSAAAAARRMQTLLGDLHDCDRWAERLSGLEAVQSPAGAAAGAALAPSERAAIEAIRLDRARQRLALHRRCLRIWARCRKERTWRNLKDVLRRAEAALGP